MIKMVKSVNDKLFLQWSTYEIPVESYKCETYPENKVSGCLNN